MDDEQLILHLLNRDEDALRELYQAYRMPLMRFISHKIQNPHDGEEVFQDVLFGFLESIRDFHGECKISTFLFSIAKHKIIDFYRRKKIKHCVFSQMPYLEDLVSPLLNPEEALDGYMVKERIREVFSRLIPRYKIILELKYMEDYSVMDIAKKFTWSMKKTESLLFRARKAFVKEFAGV